MTDGFGISVLLGGAIGAAYGLASYVTYRVALARDNRTFLVLVFGGMTVRIFVTLIAITLILLFAPIHKAAFLGSFMGFFVIGLVFEVIILHRNQTSPSATR